MYIYIKRYIYINIYIYKYSFILYKRVYLIRYIKESLINNLNVSVECI